MACGELHIKDIEIVDGLNINDTEIEELYINDVLTYCAKPECITDFSVTCHPNYMEANWTVGDNTDYVSVWVEGYGAIGYGVEPPFRWGGAAGTTYTMYVVSHRGKHTCESNRDSCTIQSPTVCMPNSFLIATPGDYLWVNSGCTSAKVCMTGGGAGGQAQSSYGFDPAFYAYGGEAGQIKDVNVVIGSNTEYRIGVATGGYAGFIGAGGGGHSSGGPGGTSSFAGVQASGGNIHGYRGTGGARDTCLGRSYDGSRPAPCGMEYGGQASLGDGGDGRCTAEASGYLYGIMGGGGGGNGNDINITPNVSVSAGWGGSGAVGFNVSASTDKPLLVDLMQPEELRVYGFKVLPDINNREEAYAKFRERANHILALWELRGKEWRTKFKNSSAIYIYINEIEKIKQTKSIDEIARIVNT